MSDSFSDHVPPTQPVEHHRLSDISSVWFFSVRRRLGQPYAMPDNPVSWVVPGSFNLCKWMNKLVEMNPGSERKVVTVWYIYSLFNIIYLSGIISTYISRWEKWHLQMIKVMQAMEQDHTHLLTAALLSFQSHYVWVTAPKYCLKWGQHWFFSHVLV